ncbi:uncharacterized protein LOC125209773 [Salvia hispanica]|uniref:uncharacterized protein LOC125199933 n=1 Tax=Salvia hispanica TaxID=49212 RepID=UPI0020091F51|nr:uncharacterized protein LOC125199933 [Salvia hispanica]XP_047965314.1 uncharacterized protein LOC125209773 [Salvia hispanica]
MGNCIFKALGAVEDMAKVVTPDGSVMELYAPITAECVTNEFPGHAIFGSPGRTSPPLLHSESLRAGHHYYLLPAHRAKGAAAAAGAPPPPYRMSVDKLRRLPEQAEAFPSAGVWKVRLVIDTDRLSEILSQEARTEALIESVRTAAKCAAAGVPSSSAASSERRSRTSAAEYW